MSASTEARTRRAVLTLLAGSAAALMAGGARSKAWAAQGDTSGVMGGGQSNAPIEIEAESGIEWRRNEKQYIARGNATAKRGDLTVNADTLTAHYRDKPAGGSEIWQIEAEGHVRLQQPGRTVTGEHAIYNLDTRILKVTGGNVGVDTGKERLTADDSLEYQDGPQIAIARGNATVVQTDRRVRADTMTGHFQRQADGKLNLVRMEADGHVEVKTPDTYATSNKGDYDLNAEIMTLSGNVKVTNAGNQFNGEYAEVNVKTGVSRLLGNPSGTGKVKSLIMPSSQPSQSQ
ncbi:MAG TPA: LptA/OstA family protein [Candidatus Acidoferrum sp.]|nr:LptA/OstA family protein [Candidatus Acidoferrum sp.]